MHPQVIRFLTSEECERTLESLIDTPFQNVVDPDGDETGNIQGEKVFPGDRKIRFEITERLPGNPRLIIELWVEGWLACRTSVARVFTIYSSHVGG